MRKRIGLSILIFTFVLFLTSCGIKKINDPATINQFETEAKKLGLTIGKEQSNEGSIGITATYHKDENSDEDLVIMYVNYSTESDAISQYNKILGYFKADDKNEYSEEEISDGKKLVGILDSVYYFETYRKSTIIAGYASTEEEKEMIEELLKKLKY